MSAISILETSDRHVSVEHLLSHLTRLSDRVQALVDVRRAADPTPEDPYRGLYVSDAEVTTLLRKGIDRVVRSDVGDLVVTPSAGSDPDLVAERAAELGEEVRVAVLARQFGLSELDVEVLMCGLAPDIDPRFEKLYGYLHDDVTRKRPSIGLAIELAGFGFADAQARGRFAPDSPLVDGGLLVIDDIERPLLSRAIRVPDRVLSHLLGDDRLDPVLTRIQLPAIDVNHPDAVLLAEAVFNRVTPIYVHDIPTGIGLSLAVSGLQRAGLGALVLDLGRLLPEDDPIAVARVAIREGRLRRLGLVVNLTEETLERAHGLIYLLAEARTPLVMVGNHPWDPVWGRANPFTLRAVRPEPHVMVEVWRECLPESAALDLLATTQFRLRPDQIARAAQIALRRARAHQRPIEDEDLRAGARAQNSSRLERLARRLEPQVSWDDLVLPPDVLDQLLDLEARYRNRDLVYGDWLMGGKNNRRLGVCALFAGPSGVGKTMAAEALASALGLDLYTINLATVVDKYIGETEKNLERIFTAAEGVNGVLFFDEADALFGKRSEVQDARDRYANVEVAYLLQRLEVFEGVAVLATNLRTNIDDAFTRRLDGLVDFPEPEEEYRVVLWDRCLGRKAPRNDDIDIEFLARRFRLSGGNIRNISVAAAFAAADREIPVDMASLVIATAREYRKLGRLCTESEFGRYFRFLSSSS